MVEALCKIGAFVCVCVCKLCTIAILVYVHLSDSSLFLSFIIFLPKNTDDSYFKKIYI